MPKKKSAKPANQQLVPKLMKWPQDWIDKINAVRGETSFSDFVRQAVGEKIGTEDLSQIAGWGGARSAKE